MYLYTPKVAKNWIAAVRAASVEVLEYLGLPTNPGSKTRVWKHGRPIGVINHFTAGVTWQGTVRWLNGVRNKKSSCNMLILDRKVDEVSHIIAKYPELDELPVLVLMLSDVDEGTWHAGWANALCWGIELRNAGPLVFNLGDWHWWANDWKAKFPRDKLNKTPINIDGSWWEPYSQGQLAAAITFCQYLHCLYQDDGGLDPSWFLPHSAISKTKWDTGRAFPIHDVRFAVFDQIPVDELFWLRDFADGAGFMLDYEEEWDNKFLEEMDHRQGIRDEYWGDAEIEQCFAGPPPMDLQMLITAGDWRCELDAIRRALNKLGYTTSGRGQKLDYETSLAVYQFQKSMGLHTDKVPGPKTQKALHKRLRDFQLEK